MVQYLLCLNSYTFKPTLMKKITLLPVLLFLLLGVACNKEKKDDNLNTGGNDVYLDLSEIDRKYFPNVTYTDVYDKKAMLGRVLFYDNHLSLNNAVSCGSCHKQEFAFADNAALSRGFEGRLTGRNTPTIHNLLGNRSINSGGDRIFVVGGLFWDKRENNLKNMVLRPVSNHIEMGIADVSELPSKLNELDYYSDLVKATNYGTDTLTEDVIADALAYFLLAIRSDSSRFDRVNALNSDFNSLEIMGLNLFRQKYNCANCHVPPAQYNMTSPDDAAIGLDEVTVDKGIGGAFPLEQDRMGVFKTPSLQNVALTAPYMHDGRFETLEEVLEHYSEGIKNHPNLDDRLKDIEGNPMRMNISDDEKKAIIAFLNTMTDYTLLTNPNYSNPFKTR